MIIPAQVDLTLRRNVPFQEEFDFTDESGTPVSFVGDVSTLQVRLYAGQPGPALIDLKTVNTSSQGLRLVDQQTWRISIDEASIAALPEPDQPGQSVSLVYDWVISHSGTEEVWVEGVVTVESGVTV